MSWFRVEHQWVTQHQHIAPSPVLGDRITGLSPLSIAGISSPLYEARISPSSHDIDSPEGRVVTGTLGIDMTRLIRMAFSGLTVLFGVVHHSRQTRSTLLWCRPLSSASST
jgi:hypothetical protein